MLCKQLSFARTVLSQIFEPESFCKGSFSSQQTLLYLLTNGSTKRIVNLCGFVSLMLPLLLEVVSGRSTDLYQALATGKMISIMNVLQAARAPSMSGLTSDPFSTNSARHRRYLTPFPRGEKTPTVYQIGCKYHIVRTLLEE